MNQNPRNSKREQNKPRLQASKMPPMPIDTVHWSAHMKIIVISYRAYNATHILKNLVQLIQSLNLITGNQNYT